MIRQGESQTLADVEDRLSGLAKVLRVCELAVLSRAFDDGDEDALGWALFVVADEAREIRGIVERARRREVSGPAAASIGGTP